MAKDSMTKDHGGKEKILAAIRRAAAELGRAPSRGELRRITGVSHYRVLAEFRTLREAVRAAGLEPNPKGEKISTEDLLSDWKRVAEKLGRRPSRAEYVREGKYSAGAFVGRFGSWSGIREKPLTTKDTKEHGEKETVHRGGAETRRNLEDFLDPSFAVKAPLAQDDSLERGEFAPRTLLGRELARTKRIKRQLPESPKVPKNPKLKNAKAGIRAGESRYPESSDKTDRARFREPGESVLHNFDRVPLAPVPTPLVGMRKVTEAVAQMVVNTLLGERSGDLVIGRSGDLRTGGTSPDFQNPGLMPRGLREEGDLDPSLAVNAPLLQDDGLSRGDFTPRGIRKDRPVMGEPFDRSPMTNAPVNELGVMVLFGMVAVGLGLQVESVQGKFPDCIARRQVAPGKWQYLRIEFEYESKNFKLHGHDPKGCDMIVCWRHNWKECPAEIEVVELSRLVGIW